MILLLVLLLLGAALYRIKGTPIHEVMHLPEYWKRVQKVPQTATLHKMPYGEHPRQYFLQGIPQKKIKATDLYIIYFHGGGWRFGSPELLQGIAHKLADWGHISFLPSHRRTPKYSYPDIKQDLIAILQQIKQTISEKDTANFRLAIGGVSAGGNVAALALLDEEIWQSAGLTRDQIAGLFLLAAPLALHTMMRSPILYSFAGHRKSSRFFNANPINHVKAGFDIPILCVHGTKDGLVPHNGSLAFREALKKTGSTPLDFHILPQATHLDMAGWVHTDSVVQQIFFDWIQKLV